jgi:hypothetical protein
LFDDIEFKVRYCRITLTCGVLASSVSHTL